MLNLQKAPPPWCLSNQEGWQCFDADAECFSMNEKYSKTLGHTLNYMKQTWSHRQVREQMTLQQIDQCAQKVGKIQ